MGEVENLGGEPAPIGEAGCKICGTVGGHAADCPVLEYQKYEQGVAAHDRAEDITPKFREQVAKGEVTFSRQMEEVMERLRTQKYEHDEDLSPEFKERVERGGETYEKQMADLNERLRETMSKSEYELLGRETGARLARTEAARRLIERRVLERLEPELPGLIRPAGSQASRVDIDTIILARQAEIRKEEQEKFIREFDAFDQQYTDAVIAFEEAERDVRSLLREPSVVPEDQQRLDAYWEQYNELLDAFQRDAGHITESFERWIDPEAERVALQAVKKELTEMEELRAEVRAFRQHA